jgi:hypothetical protein
MIRLILAALALVCVALPAEARQHHHRHHAVVVQPACVFFCAQPDNNPFAGARSIRVTMHRVRHAANPRPRLARETVSYDTQIVAHPAGCPRSAFCGCGAAVRVGFGSAARSLWLAANWFKFPRAQPGAGMVAVRKHHVFVLEQPISGDVWLTYDANSGGHATRLHARSIAGFVIVNPHAG